MTKQFVQRFLPDRDKLAQNRMLKWLGPTLLHPDLWHISRRSIAIGLAVGLFFGLMIPIAQIPVAVIVTMVLRANLAIAAASTLVTNPFTFGPIYFFAFQLGDFVLRGSQHVMPDVAAEAAQELATGATYWLSKMGDLSGPLFLGLFLLAVTSSIVGYLSVHLAWRLNIVTRKRKRTKQRRGGRTPESVKGIEP
jgi:uncharacterized protein